MIFKNTSKKENKAKNKNNIWIKIVIVVLIIIVIYFYPVLPKLKEILYPDIETCSTYCCQSWGCTDCNGDVCTCSYCTDFGVDEKNCQNVETTTCKDNEIIKDKKVD